jgi:hypothetical protein
MNRIHIYLVSISGPVFVAANGLSINRVAVENEMADAKKMTFVGARRECEMSDWTTAEVLP